MWFRWGFQLGIYCHFSSNRQLAGRTKPAASSMYKYTQLCSVSPLQPRLSLTLHFITLTANKVLTAAALWHTRPYPSMAASLGCIVIICGRSFGQKRQPPCFLAPQGIHWASIKSERKRFRSCRLPSRCETFSGARHKGGSPACVQIYSLSQHVHMGANNERRVTPETQLRRRDVEEWREVKRPWLGALGPTHQGSFLLWPSWKGQGAPQAV